MVLHVKSAPAVGLWVAQRAALAIALVAVWGGIPIFGPRSWGWVGGTSRLFDVGNYTYADRFHPSNLPKAGYEMGIAVDTKGAIYLFEQSPYSFVWTFKDGNWKLLYRASEPSDTGVYTGPHPHPGARKGVLILRLTVGFAMFGGDGYGGLPGPDGGPFHLVVV